VAWAGEFALRSMMVRVLSITQVLALSPFLVNGITLGLIAWTLSYARRSERCRWPRVTLVRIRGARAAWRVSAKDLFPISARSPACQSGCKSFALRADPALCIGATGAQECGAQLACNAIRGRTSSAAGSGDARSSYLE